MMVTRKPECLIELEQRVKPKGIGKVLKGLMTRILAQNLSDMADDIDLEGRRIQTGCPRLPELIKYSPRAAAARSPLARLQPPALASLLLSWSGTPESSNVRCRLARGPRIRPVGKLAQAAARRRSGRVLRGGEFSLDDAISSQSTSSLRLSRTPQPLPGLWAASLASVARQ